MTVSKVYLIRHGETDWNREERFQGHIDVPLNDTGRAQAQAIGQALLTRFKNEDHSPISAVVSSDLSRAAETAEIILKELSEDARLILPNLKRIILPELREAHLGDAQGLTRDQIQAQFGTDLYFKWKASIKMTDESISYPGGETGKEVLARSLQGITKVLHELHEQSPPPQNHAVVLVSHGGVMRRVLDHLRETKKKYCPIQNGALFELHYTHFNRRLSVKED